MKRCTANTESMNRLLATVKEQGVAAKDVQTTNVNVNPQYYQPPPRRPGEAQNEFVPRIVAYQVTNTVHLKVRDLDKLGAILDAVVSAGANQVYGISFQIDKPEKLLYEARKQAVADARMKAEATRRRGQAWCSANPCASSNPAAGPRPIMPRDGPHDDGRSRQRRARWPLVSRNCPSRIQVEYELKSPK